VPPPTPVVEQVEPLGAALKGSANKTEGGLAFRFTETSLPSFEPVYNEPGLIRTPDHPIGDMPLTHPVSIKIEMMIMARMISALEKDFLPFLKIKGLLPPLRFYGTGSYPP
jgi:hypothetical protein